MNLTMEMMPGLGALFVGAVMTLFAGKVSRKAENENRVRLMGVGLAFIGAILVFLV